MNPVIFALLGTMLVWIAARRLGRFAVHNFNTQAYVDPQSVPATQADRDALTVATTASVLIPQAQIASGTAEQISLARVNPVLPAEATFGNSSLDSPTHMMLPPRTG